MRLKLTRTGGFAGIKLPPVEVDTAKLPPKVARRVESLVAGANFFELPKTLSVKKPQPDRFQYSLQIAREDGSSIASPAMKRRPAANCATCSMPSKTSGRHKLRNDGGPESANGGCFRRLVRGRCDHSFAFTEVCAMPVMKRAPSHTSTSPR